MSNRLFFSLNSRQKTNPPPQKKTNHKILAHLHFCPSIKSPSNHNFQALKCTLRCKVIHKDEIQSLYILNRSNLGFYPHISIWSTCIHWAHIKYGQQKLKCLCLMHENQWSLFVHVKQAHLIFSKTMRFVLMHEVWPLTKFDVLYEYKLINVFA